MGFDRITSKQNKSPSDLLKTKFEARLKLLKEYADYLQKHTNNTEQEVVQIIHGIADEMNEKYKLGASFFIDLDNYIKDIYTFKSTKIKQSIEGLEYIVDDIDESSFDARFRTVFSTLV
jgi:hypothetical protein